MQSDWITLAITAAGQVGGVALLIWKLGRSGGELTAEVRRIATAMDKHADALASVVTDNAVQDARLDEHGRRLDNHDKEIDHLWRK